MNFALRREIIYGTSDKTDGNLSFLYGEKEKVFQNRRIFLGTFDVALEDCVVMSVEHKDAVHIVDESNRGRGTERGEDALVAEALITKEKGLILFLMTADCLPLAFYDPMREVIALAHASWKSSMCNISAKVVDVLLEKFGTNPADLLIQVGPCIHKESYRVDAAEQKELSEWLSFLEYLGTGKVAVDLVGFNKQQLTQKGVLEKNIEISPIDTSASDKFFSHYRSTGSGEPEGRFATIIGLKK